MIVLDTPALIAWLSGQGSLSAAARQVIDRELETGDIVISAISALDIADYIADGRLELSVDTRSWLSALASIEGVRVVPVDIAIAVRATTFPTFLSSHQRLIAATAIALGGALVTPDARLSEVTYAEAIW